MDHSPEPYAAPRWECLRNSRKGNSSAAAKPMISRTTNKNLFNDARTGNFPNAQWPSQRLPTTTQVIRMNSGGPAKICKVPVTAAAITKRPPSRQARSTVNTTNGIHASDAMQCGHIKQLRVKPLKAYPSPATEAASRFPVQRQARKYIPRPATKRWARQKTPSDHDNGRSR